MYRVVPLSCSWCEEPTCCPSIDPGLSVSCPVSMSVTLTLKQTFPMFVRLVTVRRGHAWARLVCQVPGSRVPPSNWALIPRPLLGAPGGAGAGGRARSGHASLRGLVGRLLMSTRPRRRGV